MSHPIRELEASLNEMTSQGLMLAALDEFYADDCTFHEGDGARRESRKAQHDHLAGFFESLKGFNGATLHAQTVGGDVSISEWTFDMTAGDETPIVWNEVLVRRWRDGKVVSERFYTAS